MSAHFGQLLSEVALAVDFKEEASWQKEKIEGVVQFPPINNPVLMGYCLVGTHARWGPLRVSLVAVLHPL